MVPKALAAVPSLGIFIFKGCDQGIYGSVATPRPKRIRSRSALLAIAVLQCFYRLINSGRFLF